MRIKGAVDQVDADDAESFLLVVDLLVEHSHVQEDLRWLAAGFCLESDAYRAVGFVLPFETAGGNRIGKSEGRVLIAARLVQSLQDQVVFIIEHRAQPLPAYVTLRVAVD